MNVFPQKVPVCVDPYNYSIVRRMLAMSVEVEGAKAQLLMLSSSDMVTLVVQFQSFYIHTILISAHSNITFTVGLAKFYFFQSLLTHALYMSIWKITHASLVKERTSVYTIYTLS